MAPSEPFIKAPSDRTVEHQGVGAKVKNKAIFGILFIALALTLLVLLGSYRRAALSATSPRPPRLAFTPPLHLGPQGTRHTFTFQGSALAVEAQAGPHWFTVWVEIDGKPANALPKDEQGRAYLNLYRPEKMTIRVLVARDLPPGEHTVILISGRGDPVWGIRALIVQEPGRDLTPPLFLGLTLLLFGASRTWPAIGARLLAPQKITTRRRQNALDRAHTWILVAAGASLPFAGWYLQAQGKTFVITEVIVMAALVVAILMRTRLEVNLQATSGQSPLKGGSWRRPLQQRSELLKSSERYVQAAFSGLRLDVARGFQPRAQKRDRLLDWLSRLSLAVIVAALLVTTLQGPHVGETLNALKSGVLFPLVLGVLVWDSKLATRRRVIHATTLGTTLLALVALSDFVTGRAVWVDGIPRIRGPFGSPNHLALVLVRALPFALLLPRAGEPRAPSPLRSARWAPTVVLLLALALTASRGAWLLGIPVTLVAFLAFPQNRDGTGTRRALLLLTGGALAAGLIFVAMRDLTPWRQRWLIWQGVWRMIEAHPWVGIGLGRFPTTYPMYALPTAWREPLLYHAHNTLLNTAAVMGVPATLALGYLLGRVVLLPTRIPWQRAARASLLGGLAFGLVDAFWALPDLAYFTALAIALLMPPRSTPADATDHTPR